MRSNKDKEYILITGCAGFIGFHFTKFLLKKNFKIIGVDMLNHYYDVNLKIKRLSLLKNKNFKFYKLDIQNKKKLNLIFDSYKIYKVVNLAAQAGVRDAIERPKKYLNYNILGFLNIIELCKDYKIKHLVYASTSSIYGLNTEIPFKESHNTDKQNQFYAVTKKTNELMAHVWSQIYNLPTTGLRFFTVYGPWGRPDMALYKFTKNIFEGKKLPLHNNGKHIRDFTYIDDVVKGIYLAMNKVPKGKKISRIYNLGNNKEVNLKYFVSLIEKFSRKTANIENLPMQKGDIYRTKADISLAKKDLGYRPSTKIERGVKNFVDWYKTYYC
ncbi:MAG: hypothetical protein CMK44_00565 [Porticoccus sp.]|nr:hypothetical protein [Porticoccus sp.]